MATLQDVREAVEDFPGAFAKPLGQQAGEAWRTAKGLFAWERAPSKADLARLAEDGGEWPDGVVLALRTDGLEAKDELLAAYPEVLFTVAHFDGYPAVLARLDALSVEFLRELLAEAWLTRVPARTAAAWLEEHRGE